MPDDDALALIQGKIAEIEEKLAKLRVTESELSKLIGKNTDRLPAPTAAAKRFLRQKQGSIETSAIQAGSLMSRIREFLRSNSPTTAASIAEGLGVETRPISFALQALKRKGEAKSAGGEWSLKGRKKAT